jgi:hypothetical protein
VTPGDSFQKSASCQVHNDRHAGESAESTAARGLLQQHQTIHVLWKKDKPTTNPPFQK